MKFSNILTHWYLSCKRDLPWRNTKNPYQIWLSEIILQQTRVDQGLAYYLRFIDEFPTVQHLADADEEKVLKLWQGLGYYSRARNLHASARYIVDELGGAFPKSYKELLKLKGVGDYTASAVSSISFDEVHAVVDGNVYRVLARYFGIETAINSTKGIKEFKALAQELINSENAGNHNQAIMEFGAMMCKPQNPNCSICPLNDSCFALKFSKVKVLPVKDKKVKIKKRYFNYLVTVTPNKKTILNQRKGKGIWQNLYEFPLIESLKTLNEREILESKEFKQIFDKNSLSLKRFNTAEKVHKLSHQHLYTTFWIVDLKEAIPHGIFWNNYKDLPVPALIDNFVEELNGTEIFTIFE